MGFKTKKPYQNDRTVYQNGNGGSKNREINNYKNQDLDCRLIINIL